MKVLNPSQPLQSQRGDRRDFWAEFSREKTVYAEYPKATKLTSPTSERWLGSTTELRNPSQ